jgi:protein-arginine kinase activator protein McsA
MEIHYCDLCANPMKDGQSWILYIANPESMNQVLDSKEEVTKYISKVQSEQKEICPTCKHLFDRIFFHRLEGMAALTEECYNLFNLPPYDKKYLPKEDKKKGKK